MYKMNPLPEQINDHSLQRLSKLETATIGHFHQFGFAAPGVQAVDPGGRCVGTAVTLALPGQDSTLLHHIIGMLRPGDFLVIDRLGDHKHACFGGGLARASHLQGFAGVAIDGPHTDTSEIRDNAFPVWSRGPSSITTRLYNIGGGFNIPVCFAGSAVNPGDAVLADESGIVFITAEELDQVLSAGETFEENAKVLSEMSKDGPKLGEVSGATKMVLEKCRHKSVT